MRSLFFFAGISLVLALTACKKEDSLTPGQMLEGRWIIDSQELLGNEVPGDGSYIEFFGSEGTGSGSDYKASDGSTGAFTYQLNEEATLLTINDSSNDGGNYDATWDILTLTDNSLRMTASTIFGSMLIELSKQ